MAKPIQSTDNLFQDIRIDKNQIKEVVRVSHVDAQDIITKIKSDDYVLNPETLYVLLEEDDQTTVVLGDGKNTFSDSVQLGGGGSGGGVSWNDLTDKPEVIASGETEEEARDSIGAGTSDYELPAGGTASTFLAGDNTWKTPTNTTYTVISEAEATTGTATTARAVSPQSQKRDILNRTRKYDNFTGVNTSITLDKIHANRNLPILCTGGSALTFTIPPVATVAWEVGDVIEIYNNHGAVLNIVAGAGVNLSSAEGLLSVVGAGWCKLAYLTTNQWQLIGNLVNPE